jgi:PadR family transcriptional regulator PadR
MAGKETQEKWISQVRKGILEFLILLCLKKKDYYGYELIREIKATVQMDVSEGTIYPLLNRLMHEGIVTSRWVDMGSGIPRKYYTITPEGTKTLADMKQSWQEISMNLNKLMET